MTAAQIDLIKKSFEDYGYYVRVICDGGLEFVTSKETLVFDDENEVLYAIDINDDILGQQKWPARVLTAPYDIIFYIESIFTLDQLKKYMDEGSISSAITEEQKQAVIKNIQGLVNKFPRENFANASGYTPRVATVKSADGTTRNISTIKEAIETAKNGDNIRLYDTVVVGEEPITIPADTEITIDLNGNNVTAKNAAFTADSGKLTVVNNSNTVAHIKSGVESFRIDSRKSGKEPELIISGNIEIDSEDNCIYSAGKCKIEVTGVTMTSTSNEYSAIQGNGNPDAAGTDITLNNCTIKSSNNIEAIYHPQNGKLTLNNCTVNGLMGIYIKAGELVLNNTNIAANGEYEEYKFNGNGCNSNGAGVLADFCDYPGGNPKVTINGGRITSKNSYALCAFDKEGNQNPEAISGNIVITSGQFVGGTKVSNSGLIDEMCAEGCVIRPGVSSKSVQVAKA